MSNLVTFEQAKQLKELGFDNSNSFHFKGVKDGILINERLPTVSEALDWIRDEKRVICAVDVDYFDGWYYTGKYQDMSKIDFQYTDSFDDHPLASSALLYAVLTYLEQKEKKR